LKTLQIDYHSSLGCKTALAVAMFEKKRLRFTAP